MTAEPSDTARFAEGGRSSQALSLNYAEALMLFDGNRTLLDMVVDRFIIDTQEHLDMLRESLAHGAAEPARQQAHRIHGGAACITAAPMAEVAGRIERASELGHLDEAAMALVEFEYQFERLKAFIADTSHLTTAETREHKCES